jgi:hypothetical protein
VIIHTVLFQPRENLSGEASARLLDDLRHAASSIASIRRFRIGRRLKHGLPGYEQAMHENYGFAAFIEFEDAAGLRTYLQHPSHQAIGAHFTISAQRALAYDYVIVEDLKLP